VLILRGVHGPPNDHAREQVQHHRQVQPAFIRRNRGDIRDPSGMGARSRKIAIEQIGREMSCRIAARRDGLVRAVMLGLQAQCLHQPHHPFASTTDATRLQGGVNAWAAVDLAIVLKNRLDFGGQPGIFSLVSTHGSLTRSVIATHRNLKNLAHQRHRILLLMLCNKLILQAGMREKMPIA
jgi:hypothetical protein